MQNKRIICFSYIMILLLLTLGCSTSRPAITDYLNSTEIINETNANDTSIRVLILSSSKGISAGSALHHFQQSLIVNLDLATQTTKEFNENPVLYDLLYLDPYLTEQEIESVQDKLMEYVSSGGILFLSQEQVKPFPKGFSGIESFVTVSNKELDFSYPKVNQNLSGIQGVWNTFAGIYKRYQGLNPEFHIDFKEAAIVGDALPIVTKDDASLLTVNTYGKGKVIWANNFLPNEQFITRFDLTPENNQKYFHFGYASANYLFRNELVKYVAKEKYGYCIQKAYGTYGRPSIAWQAHYEALYSFVLQDMIKWAKLLQEHDQIPTYSLIRGSYNGGVWHEALRYLENTGTNSKPAFIGLDDNSFFSAGSAITTKKDVVRFARYPGYNTLLAEIDLPYRAYVTAIDWNQNGYSDLLVGSYDGNVYLLLNEKLNGKPVFKKPVALKSVTVGNAAAPTAADWDQDGHYDLIVGNEQGELFLFLNNGNNIFKSKKGLTADNKPIKLEGAAAPVVTDWDHDGILDLLVGDAKGNIHFFKGKEPGSTDLTPGITLKDEHGEILVEGFAAPAVTDWDEDGLLDLIIGDATGELTLYQRSISGGLSNKGKLTGQNKNFFGTNNISVGHFAVPVIADLNNDGKKDLLTGHLEYGSPYAVDEPFFPYKKEMKKSLAYCQANAIPIIPHMYLNEYSTSENEIWEMKLHQAAFEKLGLPWDTDMGVNHHTWRINKDAMQTFMNQKAMGIWWNFGFNPPNITTAPRDGQEFLMILPFMLANNNQTDHEEFLLFSPAPNCLNFGLAWDGLARYDLPLTYFQHIEHCMKPSSKEYEKLLQEISFMNDFRNRCGYTFQTEEQMARSLLNTFYGKVFIEETNQGLIATPNYTDVPENVKEYKKTLGIKLELGEQYANKQVDTSSMFFYEGDSCYYIGLDSSASLNFVEKATIQNKLHFVQSNGPVEITAIEKNNMKLRLGTTGMQELKIYSPIKLKVKGKKLRVTQAGNYYTIIHYGNPVEISIKT